MPTTEQIDHFNDRNGLGAYERCAFALKRVPSSKTLLDNSAVMRRGLERQSIPSALAAAFCEFAYPKSASQKSGPTVRRRREF